MRPDCGAMSLLAPSTTTAPQPAAGRHSWAARHCSCISAASGIPSGMQAPRRANPHPSSQVCHQALPRSPATPGTQPQRARGPGGRSSRLKSSDAYQVCHLCCLSLGCLAESELPQRMHRNGTALCVGRGRHAAAMPQRGTHAQTPLLTSRWPDTACCQLWQSKRGAGEGVECSTAPHWQCAGCLAAEW